MVLWHCEGASTFTTQLFTMFTIMLGIDSLLSNDSRLDLIISGENALDSMAGCEMGRQQPPVLLTIFVRTCSTIDFRTTTAIQVHCFVFNNTYMSHRNVIAITVQCSSLWLPNIFQLKFILNWFTSISYLPGNSIFRASMNMRPICDELNPMTTDTLCKFNVKSFW